MTSGIDPIATARARGLTAREWIFVTLIAVGVAAVSASYFVLNGPPPPARWPSFYAWDPSAGNLVLRRGTSDPSFQAFVLSSWLDAKIPYVPALAVPYLSSLVLVPIAVPALLLRLGYTRQFFTYGLALIISQLVLDVAYVLFPTTVLRGPGSAESGLLIDVIRSGDQPFNAFPSGHAAWCTIAIVTLWRIRRRTPKLAAVLIPWLLLIYLATVALRQHYLIDVYTGVFIGYACYWGCMLKVEKPVLEPFS